MSVSDEIADRIIKHQIYLQRYKAKVVRQIVALVDTAHANVTAKLLREHLSELSVSQLAKLLNAIRRDMKAGYRPIAEAIDREIKELAGYEGGFIAELLKDRLEDADREVINVVFDVHAPTGSMVYASVVARPFNGRLLREWYEGLEEGAFARLRAAIRTGYVEGKTTDQIVRDIIGTRTETGIVVQSRRGAAAAVQTSLAHTANVAKEEFYKANADIIKAVKWLSTLDNLTTPICRARDGNVYEIGEGPRPPAHINCRSTTAPVMKSWQEMGLPFRDTTPKFRASMNGQVPGDWTYAEWLAAQPDHVQDDILGPTRAKLWRTGAITIDRFVDDSTGHEWTLDELRRREAVSFMMAGL